MLCESTVITVTILFPEFKVVEPLRRIHVEHTLQLRGIGVGKLAHLHTPGLALVVTEGCNVGRIAARAGLHDVQRDNIQAAHGGDTERADGNVGRRAEQVDGHRARRAKDTVAGILTISPPQGPFPW